MDKIGFIAYLESKGLAKSTQKEYLLRVELFFDRIKKEDVQITKPDVLNYLEYLKNEKNNNNQTRNVTLIAIRHYFTWLLENGYVVKNPTAFIKIRGTQVKKLCHIYTSDELEELYDNFYHVYIRNYEPSKYTGSATEAHTRLTRERHFIALGILIYQGLHTNELKNIRLADVDLQKAKIKIPASQQAGERTLPLKAAQTGALINYLRNINHDEYLFNFENQDPNNIIQHTGRLTRDIDKNFKNFRQIRTSVITNWLKVENLRKVQYMAGHRNINSTESYIPNNLENLIEDITKNHPFL